MISLNEITDLSWEYGLVIRGGFSVCEEDGVPDLDDGARPKTLVLFGNSGSSIWDCFSGSKEKLDCEPDPLNRWSERVGDLMASQLSGRAFFPFGGPPYQPFIRWAKKAESLKSSKIGLLIHPDYGLWHAYRFAIALNAPLQFQAMPEQDICERCEDQPCLNTCPVQAFSDSGYNVQNCYDYLKQEPQSDCRTHTCQARYSCPEGHGFHYQHLHARFHMDAFFQSIGNRLESNNK
jgi:hypothetical protein